MALPTNEILSACHPIPLSPSHPLLVGNPTRVPVHIIKSQVTKKQASKLPARLVGIRLRTQQAVTICEFQYQCQPLLLRDGLLHTESPAANGAVRRRSPAANSSCSAPSHSVCSPSLFVGASWWPSFWPFSAPIRCGRSAAHSAVGASQSIIHNPRATRRVPATPRPSTVAAIRFIILRHHTQR